MSNHHKNLRFLIPPRQEKAVAEALGLDQTWLNRVLNPHRPDGIKQPRDNKLQPLAKHFGLTLYDLKERDLQVVGTAPAASQSLKPDPDSLRGALDSVRRLTKSMELNYGSGDEVGAILRAYDHLAAGEAQDDVLPVILRYIDENGGDFNVRREPDGKGSAAPGGKAAAKAAKARR